MSGLDYVLKQEDAEQFDALMRTLTQRERFVIGMRFGLGPDSLKHTLEDTAKPLYVTRERIIQIEKRAVIKLQKRKKHLAYWLE